MALTWCLAITLLATNTLLLERLPLSLPLLSRRVYPDCSLTRSRAGHRLASRLHAITGHAKVLSAASVHRGPLLCPTSNPNCQNSGPGSTLRLIALFFKWLHASCVVSFYGRYHPRFGATRRNKAA
ncbi:hypothetical protein B0T24DRAFT_45312 [Lasiosphaeria ovina]|uniref:Secreted protein n=1 Tax=Lasiosphaeria ovina TaxID=92902 RepID=A0AAE0NKP6_9PEZI|nr:hypothetical protein B0T24DRAFT_45312 [Lasiosphaeria ovina]